ncbi:4-aminobutyrate aminotransferase [Gallibacterium genomosp. 3]|uniref:4-aminobutyrate aminotransferase n=1 Tax=Gallibacterium genomosp. 3 TaxID=505345 RepID=A0A1A7NXE4_9PAST|nr:aspartate aminotransferase family protein [Gallibacterium genomosp. 3]OBW94186.1 4-aminobutyrate aminotransferase [Gallibacterium genomosp. 3]
MTNQQYHITDALTTVHPITLVQGKNAEVWDDKGKKYIDFIGGIGVLNFGHLNPTITAAIHTQVDKLIHYAYNAAGHQPYQELMPKLCELVPIKAPLAGMFTNCGAEATENALKVARMKTGKVGVIAFDGGFHGRTLSAVNLNGKVAPYKKSLGPLAGCVYHIPYPSVCNGVSAETAKEALQRLFAIETDIDNIGAVIVEPVLGEGGFIPLDPEFAKYLRQFCDEHGIVLILDEIQAGFGRTGKPFAFMHLGIEPDLILLAKSIAGGLPLGALIGRAELLNGLPKGALGGTYSGNPVACAAALAVFEIMRGETIWQQAKVYEDILVSTYQRWKEEKISPWLGEMTGIGAMRGIVLEHPQYGYGTAVMPQVLNSAREAGLLLMPSGKYRHIIRLLPPLTIEPEVLVQGLTIFEETLKALPHQLPA